MPNYGSLPNNPAATGQSATAIGPGESLVLFNAESPAAPQASIALARGMSPSGDDAGITFQIQFAAAPTAVVMIQGSNVDQDAAYVGVFQSTNTQIDYYTDLQRFQFYRALLVSQSAGGALTVIAQR